MNLAVLVHRAGSGLADAPDLERIGAVPRFGSISFAVNRPFVTIKNGKHRFVLKVDNVATVLAMDAFERRARQESARQRFALSLYNCTFDKLG